MENYAFLIYVGCIVLIFIIGKIFIIPIKHVFRLVLNSLLGAFLISVINIVGNNFNFHIGLNWISLIVTGLLGVPGVCLLALLKTLF